MAKPSRASRARNAPGGSNPGAAANAAPISTATAAEAGDNTNSEPLGGEVAVNKTTETAAVDPAGTSTPPAGADDGNDAAQAGTSVSSSDEAGEAEQPASDPVPSPVAGSPEDDEIVETIHIAEGSVLIVTGPKLGRRRAGREFGREAVRIPLDDLDQPDLAAIMNDPRLSWTIEEPGEA